jgi:hypothetical protein
MLCLKVMSEKVGLNVLYDWEGLLPPGGPQQVLTYPLGQFQGTTSGRHDF